MVNPKKKKGENRKTVRRWRRGPDGGLFTVPVKSVTTWIAVVQVWLTPMSQLRLPPRLDSQDRKCGEGGNLPAQGSGGTGQTW